MGNETYEIKISSPLLRPGMTVRVKGVSERYLVSTMNGIMQYVRQFNKEQEQAIRQIRLKKIQDKEGGLEEKTE